MVVKKCTKDKYNELSDLEWQLQWACILQVYKNALIELRLNTILGIDLVKIKRRSLAQVYLSHILVRMSGQGKTP